MVISLMLVALSKISGANDNLDPLAMEEVHSRDHTPQKQVLILLLLPFDRAISSVTSLSLGSLCYTRCDILRVSNAVLA